jgi:hypothetical protein
MPVCICSDCGAKVITRSRFELECEECGGELVEEDAYDPEPEELRCVDCGAKVAGGARPHDEDEADRDEFYEGRYGVGDACPRCAGELDASTSGFTPLHERPEYRLAKEAARKLMRKHGLTEAPVDVEALARAEGLEVVYGAFAHEGLLIDNRIEVPVSESLAAQRFLIAHELGHWHLRHRIAESKIEPEANAFAAALVIPRAELKRVVESGPNLGALCRQFGASREAMVYALMGAGVMNKVGVRR